MRVSSVAREFGIRQIPELAKQITHRFSVELLPCSELCRIDFLRRKSHVQDGSHCLTRKAVRKRVGLIRRSLSLGKSRVHGGQRLENFNCLNHTSNESLNSSKSNSGGDPNGLNGRAIAAGAAGAGASTAGAANARRGTNASITAGTQYNTWVGAFLFYLEFVLSSLSPHIA